MLRHGKFVTNVDKLVDVSLVVLAMLLPSVQAQDTLYIYHKGVLVYKRSVLQIDSMNHKAPVIAPASLASIATFGVVTSSTGGVWMDRNLGASRVATSSTDAEGYGDL